MWEAEEAGTITNFSLDVGIVGQSAVAYCLVYVPEGYDYNDINFPAVTDDLYNPTKNVIISGILNAGANDPADDDHKFSRYSRKVVPGDRIALLAYAPTNQSLVNWELNFTVIN